ncbi:cytochrome P450 [Cladorrhinum sp. PSN332]|nr:cytochrome P450 [Cladorrhinum sp. PSN332]
MAGGLGAFEYYLSSDGSFKIRAALWTTGAVLIITWRLYTIAYNLFFHPLRHFPGPIYRRASRFPHAFRSATGVGPFDIQKLHERYGPVVRIAPNHLSFTDAEAWHDIYGPIGKNETGLLEMPKSRIYTTVVFDKPDSIINAEFHEHAMLRRALAHGFSDSSLRLQEPMLQKYANLLVQRMRERSENGKTSLNMAAFFNWATFDITGELVFGQSFGCLDKCDYHPYIAWLLSSLKVFATLVSSSYLGQRWILQLLSKTVGGRHDLLEELISSQEEWKMSDEGLSSTAFILIIAGSETSATTLCGITYLLGTHPDALSKLTREVRSTFQAEAEKMGNRFEAAQPFSYGNRNCIGRTLAQAEMRLILCRMLLEFDMKLADPTENWIKRQKAFPLWDRPALNVYFAPVTTR